MTRSRQARGGRFIRRMTRAREKILNDTINVFRDKAIEAHMFGSVGRGDSDELSDIDIWFTCKDSDIKDVLAKRMELYSEIGEIVHLCEPPQNAPIDGVHSFVLYKTEVGLLQVDLYLCPQSTSFLTKDSKKIFGEIDLPRRELSLNPNRVLDERMKFGGEPLRAIDIYSLVCYTYVVRIAQKQSKQKLNEND